MGAVADKVQPGVTMVDLHEEVEHQLCARGSRGPSFPTHLFSYGLHRHDSQDPDRARADRRGRARDVRLRRGLAGYCSDFGRTVVAGEPPSGVRSGATRSCSRPRRRDAPRRFPARWPREVNAACRGPIEEAGLGETFRHRMGHGIGVNVHEWPYISVEDSTPLEAGMTFTDEPSILWDDKLGVRDRGHRRLRRGRGPLPERAFARGGDQPLALGVDRPLRRRGLVPVPAE